MLIFVAVGGARSLCLGFEPCDIFSAFPCACFDVDVFCLGFLSRSFVLQKAVLGDEEEEEGARKRQLLGGEEEEVAGFDEADWDKKQAEVPFL